uniref:Putative secreted protein n=1 Tax=Anopheles darlingi TaxID=43151 RepID=A0A2M4D9J3_ANODA
MLHAHVSIESVERGKRLVTLVALVVLVRSIVHVDLPLMCHHVPVAAKAFGTDVAVIVLDARVRNHMTRQIA